MRPGKREQYEAAKIIARIYDLPVVEITCQDAKTRFRQFERLFRKRRIRYAKDVTAALLAEIEKDRPAHC